MNESLPAEPFLSVLVITKDEERNIERCLSSLRFGPDLSARTEIIVVDSDSRDATVSLSKKLGAIVYERSCPDCGEQKNWGIAKTRGRWVLFLDADEALSIELAQEISRAIANADTDTKAYAIERRNYFLEGYIRHCGWSSDFPIRLARREYCKFATDDPLLDVLQISDNVATLKGPMLHDSYPTISSYLRKMDRYSSLANKTNSPKKIRHWRFYLFAAPWVVFLKMYIVKLGFLDGWRGFILCGLTAFHEFAKYAKLYEKEILRSG